MNKYVLISLVILLVGSVAGGYYLGKEQVQTEVQEKVVYRDAETKIEYRDRTVIKERIVAPDGTVTEREIDKDISRDVDKKSTSSSTERDTITTPTLSRYSLGLKYWLPLDNRLLNVDTYSSKQIEVTAGYRMLGEVWLIGGYKLDNSVSVGLSLQF